MRLRIMSKLVWPVLISLIICFTTLVPQASALALGSSSANINSLSLLARPLLLGQLLGTPDTPEEIAPIDDEEAAVVHLNPDDPTYNVWKEVREDLSEGREPGPINVQRYNGSFPWIGIPTFFHLPVALTPEDLKAGNVEVAIMGAELVGDMRARTWGPMEMRNPHLSEVYHTWGSFAMQELDSGLNALQELKVVDYGDAPMEPLSLERTIKEVRKYVRDIASVEIGETPVVLPEVPPEIEAQSNRPPSVELPMEFGNRTVPIIIGGAHALMYPDFAGLTDVYGEKNIGLIHFDAHFDTASGGFGHFVTHGNPVRTLINEGKVDPKNVVQIGLRGPTSNDLPGIKWLRQHGTHYHMMAEIEREGWDHVLEEALQEARDGAKYLFISFDVDVIDPAFIPGTSTPEPGGMTMREAMRICRRLGAETNVVGIELVELRPDSDPGYTTMLNSKALLRQMLNGMAMRKVGMTNPLKREYLEPDFIHPYMLDDGN